MNINHNKRESEINYENCQACSLSLFEDLEGDVEAKTLDSFCLEKVDLIKSDCEGNDANVLKGGAETIAKYRPKIIFEHGGNESDFVVFFKELSYDVVEVAGKNFLATPR
jgi:FkbM family methyltransferase